MIDKIAWLPQNLRVRHYTEYPGMAIVESEELVNQAHKRYTLALSIAESDLVDRVRTIISLTRNVDTPDLKSLELLIAMCNEDMNDELVQATADCAKDILSTVLPDKVCELLFK